MRAPPAWSANDRGRMLSVSDAPAAGNGDSVTLNRRGLLAAAGGAVLAGAAAACNASEPASPSAAAATRPRRGGTFRLAVTGGSSSDLMDAQAIVAKPDQARLMTAFETLLEYDESFVIRETGLAERVTQDSPTQWTIELRRGIEFQNGKTFEAEDVIYSLRRILDRRNGLSGTAGLSALDPEGIRALDRYTVRLALARPSSIIADQLAQYYNSMVPVGYGRWPAPQHGTGGFTLKSFTPGQQSVHERFANCWRHPAPWFDRVVVIDFPSSTAQVNALLAHQVDAMTDVPFAQVGAAEAEGFKILVSQTGGWLPLCMAIDLRPFADNRVRQALRLLVDRPAMVEQVLSGYGRVANDLFSPFDPSFDHELPQRERDVEAARSLLRAARVSGAVDLFTTNAAAGMVDIASVFASQVNAASAGITINVRDDPNFFTQGYLEVPFSVDFWGTRNYLSQVAVCLLPTSPENETHWPPGDGPGSAYLAIHRQALADPDEARRREAIHEMQRLEYAYGGYIIPFYPDHVDAHGATVAGLRPNRGPLNLDAYGNGYRAMWFA
jgi:peptide/nickel transport system substrate-binding protein